MEISGQVVVLRPGESQLFTLANGDSVLVVALPDSPLVPGDAATPDPVGTSAPVQSATPRKRGAGDTNTRDRQRNVRPPKRPTLPTPGVLAAVPSTGLVKVRFSSPSDLKGLTGGDLSTLAKYVSQGGLNVDVHYAPLKNLGSAPGILIHSHGLLEAVRGGKEGTVSVGAIRGPGQKTLEA